MAVVIPAEAMAVLTSATRPVMVLTAVASTTAEVLVSIIFRSLAAALPDDTVTPTLEAVLIVLALIAEAISAAVPVSVVTPVALTFTVVLPSSVVRAEAEAVVSVTVSV